MIYILKIIWDYRVLLLELIVRYPQSTTSTSIRCQPAIHYLLPCSLGNKVVLDCDFEI
jgi:hypothetical protein